MADDDLPIWTLVAETREWVGPITVLANGIVTTTFDVTVTGPGDRPTVWESPTTLPDGEGVLVGASTDFLLSPGSKYSVWIRFSDTPEVPVQRVGYLKVI